MENALTEEKVVLSKFLSFGMTESRANIVTAELYERFSNLYNILNAPKEELMKIRWLSSKRIDILHSIPKLLEYYTLSSINNSSESFKMKDLIKYLFITLGRLKFEVFTIACFDIRKRFLGVEQIFRGSINTATIYPRDLVEYALTMGASYVVLAHNHPSGIVRPSKEDVEITRLLFQAFYVVHVRIIDHIIIGGCNKYSFREDGLLDKYKEDIKNNLEDSVC